MGLFSRKTIGALLPDGEHGLKRTLGAGDLVMLSIGAIIGAGIYTTVGSAAAGTGEGGEILRVGAGPAISVAFVLVAGVCGLAALCYAELAAMIPLSGSAYTYAYATMGELVAWIIGWDLILEYAVGNVYVAIAWSGYFAELLAGWGLQLPGWLSYGYWDVKGHFDPAVAGLMDTAPRLLGIPVLLNVPAFAIVVLITWLLVIGVRESARANAAMVVLKLVVLALFVIVGTMYIEPANYAPFAPNGTRGILNAVTMVFFAYIGFDAVSTAAEETRNPQRNVPRGILGGLLVCTVIYVIVGLVATGLVPYEQLRSSDPLAHAFGVAGLTTWSWIIAFGALISMSAVLLVFQYGQPRIFFAMARDGLLPSAAAAIHPKYRTPHVTTIITGVLVAVAAMLGDGEATLDLVSIGTLFAFAVVCIGVLVLRIREPDRPRPFRVPAVWLVSLGGAAACIYVMAQLPWDAWTRLAAWLGLGLVVYIVYGYRHSLARTAGRPDLEDSQ